MPDDQQTDPQADASADPQTFHIVQEHEHGPNGPGFPRLTLSGDAVRGWITEIHDGKIHHVVSVGESSFEDALAKLRASYKDVVKDGWHDMADAFREVEDAVVTEYHKLAGTPQADAAAAAQNDPNAPATQADPKAAPSEAEQLNQQELQQVSGAGGDPASAS